MIDTNRLIENSKDHAILMYDGDCILCSGFVQRLIKFDKKDQFRFCALQKIEGFQSSSDITTVILVDNGIEYFKSDVTFRIIEKLGGLWLILWPLKLVPKFIRDWIYDKIAQNRYQWFGRKENCLIPSDRIKSKFICL